MVTNITIGAPPGIIMKGSRAPNFHGPKACSRLPSPQTRNVALISFSVRSTSRFSALATRKTEVMGTAAITSTCWRPKSRSWAMGNLTSTGWTEVGRDMALP